MSNWMPSNIKVRADSIVSHAQQIDQMLWFLNQYKVEKRDVYDAALLDRLNDLKKAISEFKELDTDSIITELEKDVKAWQALN